ncbi:MAG: helix-turn-helix transcriptional regulator [Chloroflexota bacterium]|nr:MAG: helix-turn-helix transcriptional regulator [Chloroflexota bacterium]
MTKRAPEKSISRLLDTIGKSPRILILMAIGEGEACVCHLEAVLGYKQAYISQNLMALRKAKLLKSRREGRFVFYQVSDRRLLDLIRNTGELAGISEEELEALDHSSRLPNCCCPNCIGSLEVAPIFSGANQNIVKMA